MRKVLSLLAPVAMLAAVLAPASTQAAPGGNGNGNGNGSTTTLSGNTPLFVPNAQNLGPSDPSQTIDATVWLRLKNENQLQQQATAVTTPGNSSYHKFLPPAQVQATYDPSSQSVNAVTNYLHAKGLTVIATAENNYYVKVEGTVGQMEKAFHVAINNYSYHGHTYRSNAADPQVDNSNGVNGQIAAVTGLDDATDYSPMNLTPASGTGGSGPASYTGACGDESPTITLADGSTTTLTGLIPCGYGAQQIETAYGVNQVCHLSGTYPNVTYPQTDTCGQGQTIAITDAYGSSSLQQDVNAYDAQNNLPALTIGQNLTVLNPPGIANMPENKRQDPLGWQAEVTLDVENAHAIAPGANIVLVAAANNYADLDEALNTVVVHRLANIVSSSWATLEDYGNPARFNRDERILQTGTLEGIGFNFSSGDEGDDSVYFGGAYNTVEYPASSPFATAIGGTSLFLNSDNSYAGESGWGTGLTEDYHCAHSTPDATGVRTCDYYNTTYVNPSTGKTVQLPLDLGFQFGSGGGMSRLFAAPTWQSAIPNATLNSLATSYELSSPMRAVPDVSMLADPYTGSTIYITDHSAGDTSPVPETYGGTSLASPLFAGMMALVDQERASEGKGPTGLASQNLYSVLNTSALHDISGVPYVAQNDLYYMSHNSGNIFSVSFGTDGPLTTTSGWDDVTGVGSPNGSNFIDAMAGK